MTDRIDPKAIADELRNQASPSAIQRDLFARAANTIDALVKERDEALRSRGVYVQLYEEAEQERDELFAVVEKVRGVIGSEIGWESPAILIDRIQWALSTTPADALAEHDAALIESLADDRGVDASEGNDDDEWWMGYRQAQREIIHWLTERARQVREGEA